MTALPMPIADSARLLAGLEQAKALLAAAQSVDEVRQLHDQAEAMRVYARQAQLGLESQNYAAEIKLRAERRAGEMLADVERSAGRRTEKTWALAEPRSTALQAAYAQTGIKPATGKRWQAVARVPEAVFDQHVAETKAKGKELTSVDVAKIARQHRPPPPPPPPVALRLPETVRLEVADALALPLADASVDLIVTSPPYGLAKPYAGIADLADGWHDFMADWLVEAYRVTRDGGRLALNVPLDTTEGGCRPTYAQAVSAACGVGWAYRWTIVWLEENVSHRTGRGSVDSASAPHVIAPVEMIAVFYRGEWRREPPGPSDLAHADWLAWTDGLWRFGGESRPWGQHPAPFPLELPRRLITLLSFPGDTVLDPFVGSGTTAIAAHRLGRVAIGFDQAPEYIAAARRRFAADRV
jgi:site-specific DNA-methyltransferase (adenine-specific)